MATDCLFCKIVNGEIPSTKIYEDDDVIAFLDISQTTIGHTLVVPKQHFDNFLTTNKDIIDQLVSNDIKYEYLNISHEEIYDNCFQINSTNCNPSLNNVFLQTYAKNTNFDYYWFVEYDVAFYNKENNNNSFKPLFNYFKNKKYDLICDHYRQLTANAEYIYRYSYFINSIKTFV